MNVSIHPSIHAYVYISTLASAEGLRKKLFGTFPNIQPVRGAMKDGNVETDEQ